MGMKYRGRFDIASTILKGVRDGYYRKTRLMYVAYVSYGQLDEYLSFLIKNSLLAESDGVYSITDKGMRFLHKYEELMALVDAGFG